MNGLSTPDLLSLAKEKKELLSDILLLSYEQSKVIKNDEFEKLEEILDKKDLLIEKIDDIDLKLKSFLTQKQIEDEALLREFSQIKDILNKMKVLDDENNKKLSEAMHSMQDGIKDIRQGMRAARNYNNSDPYHAFATQGGTLFIDQES